MNLIKLKKQKKKTVDREAYFVEQVSIDIALNPKI